MNWVNPCQKGYGVAEPTTSDDDGVYGDFNAPLLEQRKDGGDTLVKRPLTEKEMDDCDAAEARRRLADSSDGTTSLSDLRDELGI